MNGPDGRQHADDLLSAHLDGELDLDESAWVRSHLEDCAGCRNAAEDLVATRALLRSLPLVDSTPMVEGILARHRTLVRAGSAFVGLAAVALCILGLTASVRSPVVELDVEAMAAAHADRTQSTRLGLRSVSDVDGMYAAPPRLVGAGTTLTRSGLYDGRDLMVVMYGHDEGLVTVYEQPGSLDWGSLPAGGFEQVNQHRVWMSRGSPTVGVTELGHLVVTVVSYDPESVRAAVAELPDRHRGSVWDRIHDACQRFTDVFAFGD